MAIEKHTATRRAILGAALATTVTMPVAAATIKQAGQEWDSAAWDQAFAAWQRAVAECDAYDDKFEPIYEACRAETEKVPHVTLEPDPYTGKTHQLSTANAMDVAEARFATRGRYSIDPQYPDAVAHYALMERLVAAADARDAEVERIHQRYGWDEANDRSEALAAAASDAETMLLEMPAPTMAALTWKLEQLFGDDEPDGYCGSFTVKWTHQLVADARRLSGRA